MREARAIAIAALSCVPNRDAGFRPVIQVTTDRPAGEVNAFYMDVVDLAGEAIKLAIANLPAGAPNDPAAFNVGDSVEFDVQDGLHKCVLWKGLKIRQRDYSFDWLAKP